jgi:hypothetical protein
MLTFDEAAHEYHWDGKPVPNVTRIIAPLTDYSHIPPERLDRARQQGKARAQDGGARCEGDLDVRSCPSGCAGTSTRGEVQERYRLRVPRDRAPLYHPRLGYAGTLDLAGLLPKLKNVKKPAVIDVKRSFYAGPAIGLQTAAYEDAANSDEGTRPPIGERYALQLNANGTYRLEPFTDRDDRAAFLACLQQLRWKEKHYGPK